MGEARKIRTRFVELLAGCDNPLGSAPAVIEELTDAEKREVLDAHPAIGQTSGLSARSAAEQGLDADPEVLAELARLNAEFLARGWPALEIGIGLNTGLMHVGDMGSKIRRASSSLAALASCASVFAESAGRSMRRASTAQSRLA